MKATASGEVESGMLRSIPMPHVDRAGVRLSAVGQQMRAHVAPLRPSSESSASYEATLRACRDPQWLASHGPSFSMLRSEPNLLNPAYQQVHALPAPYFKASNFVPGPQSEELYFVNGMGTGPRDLEHQLASLTKTFGRPVTAIINGQESALDDTSRPGLLRSVWNCVCGLLSSHDGFYAERSAVSGVEQAIVSHVRSGQPLHLVAHSQGSIIVGNALDRLMGEGSVLSSVEKSQAKHLVRVSTFGAAEHFFPKGVKVQEYAHRGDGVALITGVITQAREAVMGVWSAISSAASSVYRGAARVLGATPQALPTREPKERAPVVLLEGDHDFGPYIEKLPDFFIEKHSAGSEHAGLRVAEDLKTSIRRGALSDVMHGMIIDAMVRRGDRAFACEMLRENESGHIGSYKIPFVEELARLRGRP